MTVTGDKELLRELASIRKAVRLHTRKATSKASSFGAKSVKAKIQNRSVKKAIGWRLMKSTETGGEIVGKIGGAVGKKKRAVRKAARKRGARATGDGVGIDARNVHWWFLGTAKRFTGTKRVGAHRTGNTKRKLTGKSVRYTGKMPAQDRPISVLIDNAGTVQVLRTYLSQNVVKK